jgi:hypothetical protein
MLAQSAGKHIFNAGFNVVQPRGAAAKEENRMKKLIGGLALLFLVGGTPANAAPWCAFYDASTYNCGFHSFEQCMATVRGAGGWCRENLFESGDRKPASRKPRNTQ